ATARRRARCPPACLISATPGTWRSAPSAATAASRGAATRCLSRCRWPANMSHSKKSTTACGRCGSARSRWPVTTTVIARSTRLPRSRLGARPALPASRLTGRTVTDNDQNPRSTVTDVAGLICYPCPRPSRPRTSDLGPRMGRVYNRCMLPLALAFAIVAQTPQPFPKPGTAKPAPTAPATPASPPATQTVLPPQQSGAPGANDVPTETSLGVPIYPGAEFLTSFDATRGQRYYLFG